MSGRIFEMRDKLKQGLEKEGKDKKIIEVDIIVGECG